MLTEGNERKYFLTLLSYIKQSGCSLTCLPGESNLLPKLRRLLFYPLNYGSFLHEKEIESMHSIGIVLSVFQIFVLMKKRPVLVFLPEASALTDTEWDDA